jgi:vitamin K-dependent gamma-carboxylase-like protein
MTDVLTDPQPETRRRANTEPGPLGQGLDVLTRWYDVAQRWLLCDQHSLYGSAFARILSGCAVLGTLITNFRQRDLLFGPASVWNKPLQDVAPYWPPDLVAHMGSTTFLFWYLGVIALAVLWVLGWHAKLVGPLMLLGNISIIERIPILGDQGDNILRVGLVILMFMNVTEHWSLDARRRARTDAAPISRHAGLGRTFGAVVRNIYSSQPVLPAWLSNGIHNIALAMLAFQLTIIYISAGMFKTQGALWQHGTALYYPLQLQEFKPFPFLTDLFTYSGLMVGVATYVVVFIQLFFTPMLMLSVATRRIAIATVLLFHLSIAVMMALPWFSMEMVAFDSIFVSAGTYIALGNWLKRRGSAVSDRWFNVTDPMVDRLSRRTS